MNCTQNKLISTCNYTKCKNLFIIKMMKYEKNEMLKFRFKYSSTYSIIKIIVLFIEELISIYSLKKNQNNCAFLILSRD